MPTLPRGLLALLFWVTSMAAAQQLYENERFGFRVALGDEWQITADKGSGSSLRLTIDGHGVLERCHDAGCSAAWFPACSAAPALPASRASCARPAWRRTAGSTCCRVSVRPTPARHW